MSASTKETQTIGASELAKQLKVEPKDLRLWLRSESKNVGRGKRYEFTSNEAASLKRKFKAAQKESS